MAAGRVVAARLPGVFLRWRDLRGRVTQVVADTGVGESTHALLTSCYAKVGRSAANRFGVTSCQMATYGQPSSRSEETFEFLRAVFSEHAKLKPFWGMKNRGFGKSKPPLSRGANCKSREGRAANERNLADKRRWTTRYSGHWPQGGGRFRGKIKGR